MNPTKPKREKRRYDDAFRRNAITLLEQSGKPLSAVAAELGIPHWSLRDWARGHNRRAPVPAATPQDLQRELARLRQTNARLEVRCELLKKALGILAEPSPSASPE